MAYRQPVPASASPPRAPDCQPIVEPARRALLTQGA